MNVTHTPTSSQVNQEQAMGRGKRSNAYAIKNTEGGKYGFLQYMYKNKDGVVLLAFHNQANAFRFPDENTAFAVLAFLNRDNLEVVCIE